MSRGWRLIGQLALLPVMWLLVAADSQAFQFVIVAAILIVWPVTVAVAVVLVWLTRAAQVDPEAEAPATLLEAADNAVTMALISTGLAATGLVVAARLLGFVDSTSKAALVFLGWALVLVGVPSLSWARTLRQVWLPMLTRRK